MDPYYIMPILTSLTMLATIEVHHTPLTADLTRTPTD
jgi:hypothetical protein